MNDWTEWKDWRTVKTVVRRGPHRFIRKLKRLPWPYCTRCGLVALRNAATRASVCVWEEEA